MTTFILTLDVGLLITFFCVGSPLVAYHLYHKLQGITTQRFKSRARIGVMVLTCIALIAVLSLVLFTIHPPSSKFAISFFMLLFLVSQVIFQWAFVFQWWVSPLPPPPVWRRLRIFSLLCFVIAIGAISLMLIDSLVGFLR